MTGIQSTTDTVGVIAEDENFKVISYALPGRKPPVGMATVGF